MGCGVWRRWATYEPGYTEDLALLPRRPGVLAQLVTTQSRYVLSRETLPYKTHRRAIADQFSGPFCHI